MQGPEVEEKIFETWWLPDPRDGSGTSKTPSNKVSPNKIGSKFTINSCVSNTSFSSKISKRFCGYRYFLKILNFLRKKNHYSSLTSDSISDSKGHGKRCL